MSPSSPRRAAALLAALAAVTLIACSHSSPAPGSSHSETPPAGTTSSASTSTSTGPSASPTASPTRTVKPKPPAKPVHISLLNGDGRTFGVGMPEIAYFSTNITDARPLQKATTVTVNGKAAVGAWYFESSDAGHGPMEGHYRLNGFWPAHAHVHIDIPAKGLPAGKGLVFDDSLTSDWHTGAKHVAVVNAQSGHMTLSSDDKVWGTFPVSLGANATPTMSGTKVVMEQLVSVCMHDTAGTYHECGIKWDQRLTYSGEYLHAAPWNCVNAPGCTGPQSNIGTGVNSSNGCTNLLPNDAERLYHFMRIGDVVKYPNANGPHMSLGAGYGDWNVPWSQWLTGGAVPTR